MQPGEDVSLNPQPIPPGRQAVYRAIGELTSAAFLDADGPSGSADPHGPGGPVMREITIALALTQLGSLLSDRSLRNEVQDIASRVTAAAAERRLG
jgi:hypothetical protein